MRKQFVPLTQEDLNKEFEDMDCTMALKVSRTLRTTFLFSFYSILLPIGPLLAIMILTLDYWVYKFLFLRRFKEPDRLRMNFFFHLLQYLRTAPLMFIGGNIVFLKLVSNRIMPLDIVLLAFCFVYRTIPLRELWKQLLKKVFTYKKKLANFQNLYYC